MTSTPRKPGPLLAVSIGCPAGVGPEVAVAAAARFDRATPVLVGDAPTLRRAAGYVGVDPARLEVVDSASRAFALAPSAIAVWAGSTALPSPCALGRPDAQDGRAQLAWIDEATDLVTSGTAAALVTGPVSKKVIASSGALGAERFRGHTEHLAERLGAASVTMAFYGEKLATSLVTTHLPLSQVPSAITPRAVCDAIVALAGLLASLGVSRGRVAVCALNPHAGEEGLLGTEETTAIKPGIAEARARLSAEPRFEHFVLAGPLGAESAYRLAVDGKFDGVVGMYHDQATIACKLTGFGEAVNVTLGLPIVRTSVDHGTAYDLAGSGKASDQGMFEALMLAARMALPGAASS